MTDQPGNRAADLAVGLESFHRKFETDIREIDRELVELLDRFQTPATHYGMIRYHFGFADRDLRRLTGDGYLARGKRLRPVICLLFCRMLKLSSEVAGVVMMATEVMHSASLVHDDIEDKDAVRWGRPTIHSLFALEQAINVGDALTGIVYHLLLSLRSKGVDAEAVLELIAIFNRTHLRMCEGQHLDLRYRYDDDISLADYLDMVSRKTASQCVCIADTISILAASPPRKAESFRRFGEALGMLYQVCDDIRGIWCDSDALGRLIGQDVRQCRASLPLLYGYKHGSPKLRQALRNGLARTDDLPDAEVADLRRELTACGAQRLCHDVAAGYYQAAADALDALQTDSLEVRALRGILSTCFASVSSLA